jgi:hypothetical protein
MKHDVRQMVASRIEFPNVIVDDITNEEDGAIINAFFPMCCECMG